MALEAIGAGTTAEIVRRAANKFPDGRPPKDWSARHEILLQISSHADALKDLGSEFYQPSKDLAGLLAKYRLR